MYEYDVIVCGAGCAGFCASIAAAISISDDVKVENTCIKKLKKVLSEQRAIVPGISCGENF